MSRPDKPPETGARKPRRRTMLFPTIVMGVLAISLSAIAYSKGNGQMNQGLHGALKLTIEIMPIIFFAMIVAGMMQVLIPKPLIAQWVGAESGMRGILLGTIGGALAPGGPFVSMPIAASLLQAGAGFGTMVAFITSWSCLSLARIPLEVGILGWNFAIIRFTISLIFPPIAGVLANLIARSFH